MSHFSTEASDNGNSTGQVPPDTTSRPQAPEAGTPTSPLTDGLAGLEVGSAAVSLADPIGESSTLQPLASLQPRRKIDLSTAVLPEPGSMAAVESLAIKELKGVGQTFTANVDVMLSFHGLVYKPPSEYETIYQVIAAPLINDPRVMSRATRIAFVPAFSWSTFEVVLVPFKLTTFGRKVLDDLVKLKPTFPRHKTFVQWESTKKRHIVYFADLSEQELATIVEVRWPAQEQILEALQATAFDNLDDLLGANEEIRALVTSKEVK
jgi:hypothetical protein